MENKSKTHGIFIILIKDFSAQLIFIKNINLNVLTLKLIKSEPLIINYRNVDLPHIVYQTKCVGGEDKHAVMNMLIGMTRGSISIVDTLNDMFGMCAGVDYTLFHSIKIQEMPGLKAIIDQMYEGQPQQPLIKDVEFKEK